MNMLLSLLILISLYLSAADISEAADGKAVIEQNKCAACHEMNGSQAKTFDDILNRKGPNLSYAGSKFKEKFLIDFLQKPYHIRPAGTFFINYTTAGEDIDRIHEPPVCASKLSGEDAQAAARYLMTLKDPNMQTGVYKPGIEFPKSNAKMVFFKSAACTACHQVDTGGSIKGGISAPVLYNAGARLNGDWVFSYIKDPQHWEPKTFMPKRDLPDNIYLLLTNFVMTMEKAEDLRQANN